MQNPSCFGRTGEIRRSPEDGEEEINFGFRDLAVVEDVSGWI